jgi:hypothetical protein
MIDRFELDTVLLFLQTTGSERGNSLLGDADLRLGLGRFRLIPRSFANCLTGGSSSPTFNVPSASNLRIS